jgi:hypothetical protein
LTSECQEQPTSSDQDTAGTHPVARLQMSGFAPDERDNDEAETKHNQENSKPINKSSSMRSKKAVEARCIFKSCELPEAWTTSSCAINLICHSRCSFARLGSFPPEEPTLTARKTGTPKGPIRPSGAASPWLASPSAPSS